MFLQTTAFRKISGTRHSVTFHSVLGSWGYTGLFLYPQKSSASTEGRKGHIARREVFKVGAKICVAFFAEDFAYAISSQRIIY